ncbi:hypothetical protein [Lentzea nigeriaca]|uniref:hypothetical protein n=1 Tax=Lentzea nigeriaca TaxID=1128665 RepID=UPI00195AE14E|nr:hypothetical protein [Lentzea nigeriaca]MBM7859070.1 hypothetical protein [Lentzea nigeriaca]
MANDWRGEHAVAMAPVELTDPLDGDIVKAGPPVTLGARDVRVFTASGAGPAHE